MRSHASLLSNTAVSRDDAARPVPIDTGLCLGAGSLVWCVGTAGVCEFIPAACRVWTHQIPNQRTSLFFQIFRVCWLFTRSDKSSQLEPAHISVGSCPAACLPWPNASRESHGLDGQAGRDWRDTHPPQLQHRGLQAWSGGGCVSGREGYTTQQFLAFNPRR